jgi:hypothetical protein
VAARKTAVERGDEGAVYDALRIMLMGDVPMPGWLRAALRETIERYESHEVSTLDEAFSVQRPPGYRRPAARAAVAPGYQAVRDANDLAHAGAVIDDALFEAVAMIHDVGSTSVKKWYYASAITAIERERHGKGSQADLPSHLLDLVESVNWKR